MKFEQRLLTFIVFLFISAVIWLFNALHKEYTTEITIPVYFKNIPNEFIPHSYSKNSISVRIKASGFRLIGFLYSGKNVFVTLDASEFALRLKKDDETLRVSESSYELSKLLKNELNEGVQIVSVWPDSMIVEFSKSALKKLPVELMITYHCGAQHVAISSPLASPDSVTIIGPKLILDTMKRIQTEKLDLGKLTATTEGYLSLNSDKNLRIVPQRIKYTVNIDRYSEKLITVSPVIINVPDSVKLMFWPEKINVRISVALSKFNDFDSRDITVFADFKKLKTNNKNLPLEINNLPGGVFNPILFPAQIECNIQK